jgi:hypothetical protein
MLGIIQTAWILWVENLLQTSVNTAARCGAVNSTTSPCSGSDMVGAANVVFGPLTGAAFSVNAACSAGNVGLVGTYTITFLLVIDLTMAANSCYPTVSS